MITEDYVSFRLARLLNEKGFVQEPDYATSWYASRYYKNACQGEWFEGEHQIIDDIDDKCNISYLSGCGVFIPAPTLQTTMKWLREKHNLAISISVTVDGWCSCVSRIKLDSEGFVVDIINDIDDGNIPKCDTYEQECEAAIVYCLDHLI